MFFLGSFLHVPVTPVSWFVVAVYYATDGILYSWSHTHTTRRCPAIRRAEPVGLALGFAESRPVWVQAPTPDGPPRARPVYVCDRDSLRVKPQAEDMASGGRAWRDVVPFRDGKCRTGSDSRAGHDMSTWCVLIAR